MSPSWAPVATGASQLHERLSAALAGSLTALRDEWECTAGDRAAALKAALKARDRDTRSALHLLFSLVAWRLGESAKARSHAVEAWQLIDGRAPASSQALVLTQLAASQAAGADHRSALRAARRAEALLAADGGDPLPQMVVVRSQLIALCCLAGVDDAEVRERRDRTLAHLESGERVRGGLAGLRRLREVFCETANPPHWAWVHHLRWAGIFER